MGEDIFEEPSSQRKLSIPRLILLITSCTLLYYWIRNRWTDDSSHDHEIDSSSMTMRIREIEKHRKEEEDFEKDFQKSLNSTDKTELFMGSFRYKLVLKPKLPFKIARSYCRNMSGTLAMVPRAQTPRKLQRLIGLPEKKKKEFDYGYPDRKGAVWVGKERQVKKKKKPKKVKKAPVDGEEGSGSGETAEEEEDRLSRLMNPMMMGGRERGEPMCPALSPNSLYVPIECHSNHGFICEFLKTIPRLPAPQDKKYRSRGRYGSEMMHDPEEM